MTFAHVYKTITMSVILCLKTTLMLHTIKLQCT